jgi:hypothetical protein
VLASIHPLGERARGRRWAVTVTGFIAGAALAGAGAGMLLGWLGAVAGARARSFESSTAIVAAVVGLALVGAALDLRWAGLRLPTVQRQVNEDWLHRYRGAVYGIGFGFQLGLGVATIVTTAAVYLTFVIAFFTSSAIEGAVVGATFGLVRGGTILTAARIERPEELWMLHRRLQRWAPVSHALTIVTQVAVAAVLVAVTVA